jgi:hypothetical protein
MRPLGTRTAARGWRAASLLTGGLLAVGCGFAGVGAPMPQTNSSSTPATTGIESPSRVAVTPFTVSIKVGDSVQFVATAIKSTGVSAFFSTPTWNFGPDSIGTLAPPSGNDTWLRTRKAGTATIYAIVSGVTGTATVTVTP